MSKAPKGDHSFQPSGAGKGDADRTSNVEAFRANYDEINWGSKPKRWLGWPLTSHQPTLDPLADAGKCWIERND